MTSTAEGEMTRSSLGMQTRCLSVVGLYGCYMDSGATGKLLPVARSVSSKLSLGGVRFQKGSKCLLSVQVRWNVAVHSDASSALDARPLSTMSR